jgi:hypothetical protein
MPDDFEPDEPDFLAHLRNVLDDYKDGTLESRDDAVEAIIQHPVVRVALRMKLVGHALDAEAPHS